MTVAEGDIRAKVYPCLARSWTYVIETRAHPDWSVVAEAPVYDTWERATAEAHVKLERVVVNSRHRYGAPTYVYPVSLPEAGDTAAGLLRDLYVDTAQRCDDLETCACSEARAFRYLKEDLA